ncbi:MAG: FAD-dependent oxidoreductase, partial [Planctomycetota bacterium]
MALSRALGLCAAASLAAALAAAGEESPSVNESARKIPVAYDVDVVIAGGGAGAVAAAVAAAKDGAKVFLAAPRNYLGEDTAGTLRVWTDPATPLNSVLAEKLFGAQARESPAGDEIKNRLPFNYQTDKPSGGQHRDTVPPSLLSDGKWHSAVKESVQYDGAVTLVADLGGLKQIAQAGVMAYHAKDFLVESLTVSTSADNQEWKEAGVIKNTAESRNENSPALPLLTPLNAPARYVRFHVEHKPESKRLLLGEIILTGPEEKEKPAGATAGGDAGAPILVRPLHVKRTLDEALLAAGVQYLFGCYVCDVLRDAQGQPGGIVMADRAGRQAVSAKVIIDATDRAWVA